MIRLSTFPSDVRGVVLAGLSTATNAAITAADNVLSGLGKLQAQITAALATANAALPKAGGTMTGNLILSGASRLGLQGATNSSLWGTILDGASYNTINFSISSWQGIGLTSGVGFGSNNWFPTGVLWPCFWNARNGDTTSYGNLTYYGNTTRLSGGVALTTAGATTTLDLTGWTATLSSATPVSGGASGFTTADCLTDPQGNIYIPNTVVGGVITAIQLGKASVIYGGTPANPVTLTPVTGVGTGTVSVNLTWSRPTTLALNPTGGTVTSTTPAAGDNSTKVVTTAWYAGRAGTANPTMDGTVAVGTSLLFARQDHVHPSDTTLLARAGGTMTGALTLASDPATPLQAATKQYVDAVKVTFATIASLQANATAFGATGLAYVQGYSGPADGGEGFFVRVTADTTSLDNGGTIVVDAAGQRWYREGGGSSLSIEWFGGSPSATDNAPALALALAALAAHSPSGGEITAGRGTYNFSSLVSFTYPSSAFFSCALRGQGADATVFNWASTDGLAFNLSQPGHSIHLRDLTVSCNGTNVHTGVLVNQSFEAGAFMQSDFTGCTFRGTAGTNGCWLAGLQVVGLSAYSVVNCMFNGASVSGAWVGVGALCQGQPSITNQISAEQNFTGCTFNFCGEGIVYGDFIQGMTVNQTNFTACTFGIHQRGGAGATEVGAQLSIIGSQFNCVQNICIEGALGDLNMTGSLFYSSVAGAVTVNITSTSTTERYAITGCMFESQAVDGTNGILLGGTSSSQTITGNTFFNFVVAISFSGTTIGTAIVGNTIQGRGATSEAISLGGNNQCAMITGNTLLNHGNGIVLGSSSSNNNVQSNSYVNVTNKVFNAGTGNTVGGGSL